VQRRESVKKTSNDARAVPARAPENQGVRRSVAEWLKQCSENRMGLVGFPNGYFYDHLIVEVKNKVAGSSWKSWVSAEVTLYKHGGVGWIRVETNQYEV
jgi:hypothetical protein